MNYLLINDFNFWTSETPFVLKIQRNFESGHVIFYSRNRTFLRVQIQKYKIII